MSRDDRARDLLSSASPLRHPVRNNPVTYCSLLGFDGAPGAIRTRDPQLRRLFEKSRNLWVLLNSSTFLVRSRSAMRCQEVP